MYAPTVEYPKEKLSSTHKSSELNNLNLLAIYFGHVSKHANVLTCWPLSEHCIPSTNEVMFPPMPVGWVLI